ncbi:MAG: glycosyltransferase, partial [Marinoscillum sp.]
MAERSTDISMVIVVDGPARQELQQNMPNAIFTGKLVGEDLSRAYASSDVFVFPSTTETFGNVILEAMASGLPVVAADKGGPSDILRTGETGFLVKPQMEEEFYDRIVQLADQ